MINDKLKYWKNNGKHNTRTLILTLNIVLLAF